MAKNTPHAGHGGYREPANPAAVSGPGALSRRTDGAQPAMTLPDAAYGENADYQAAQGGAPVPEAPAGPQHSAGAGALFNQLTGMGDPSQQPGTPVTDGAQYGPGQDQSALGLDNPLKAQVQQLGQNGFLAIFMKIADSDSASPDFRAYVRALLAAR